MTDSLLFKGSEWTFPLIEKVLAEVENIGRTELGLKLRPNQVEVITADQMLSAYVSHGMPVHYSHWSNGKNFLRQKQAYDGGQMGLAYEIVINSSPVIAYCMEGNSMAMQTLVLAHASVGHASFFEMNYLFKNWTDPEGIVDYLLFAKKYIRHCEERYGIDAVEDILDAAHALRYVSFDRYKRAPKINKEVQRQKEVHLSELQEQEKNEFSELLPKRPEVELQAGELEEPEENILYFLAKKSPVLEQWQRELLRINYKISQYFYPQLQTQLLNEGWASTTHYYILNRLYEMGKIDEGTLLECMHSHTQVVDQPQMSPNMNPYALGFAMFKDIRRICENPTPEDREWFPDLVDTDYKKQWLFAMQNFRDESFILQYLSPKLMREWRMFQLYDNPALKELYVYDIHNESGYNSIRQNLADSYRLENRIPNIMVLGADLKGTRTLTLGHVAKNDILLKEDSAKETLKHIRKLWGYPVHMLTMNGSEDVLQNIVV